MLEAEPTGRRGRSMTPFSPAAFARGATGPCSDYFRKHSLGGRIVDRTTLSIHGVRVK